MMLSIPKYVSLLIATRQKLSKCQGIKLNVNKKLITFVDLPCVNSTKTLLERPCYTRKKENI